MKLKEQCKLYFHWCNLKNELCAFSVYTFIYDFTVLLQVSDCSIQYICKWRIRLLIYFSYE